MPKLFFGRAVDNFMEREVEIPLIEFEFLLKNKFAGWEEFCFQKIQNVL